MSLVRFRISNFRGIVEMEAHPDGKSVVLRGKNGAGKSSAVDSIFWGLGGNLDGDVVRNGAEVTETEVVFGEYLVRRRLKRGGKPTLTVKSADGKATYNSPTALLAGFLGALERRTFTTRAPKEQAEILRKLAPGLDCSDLDAKRAELYEQRTDLNREAKQLRAQADGVAIPEAPEEVGEEVDLAAIAGKKAEVERQRANNEARRNAARRLRRDAEMANDRLREADRAAEDARHALQVAIERAKKAAEAATHAEQTAASAEAETTALVDPDASAIDAEIAAAKQHNAKVRQAQRQAADRAREEQRRALLASAAASKETASEQLTAQIDALDAERAARIAAARCPIPGLALAGDAVTFDDGRHGAVEARIGVLNDAACVRLDVEVAAALGYRLVAIRNAERLDPEHRRAVEAIAAERGVQLICEVRTDDGATVEAVIEEGEVPAAAGEQLDIDL